MTNRAPITICGEAQYVTTKARRGTKRDMEERKSILKVGQPWDKTPGSIIQVEYTASLDVGGSVFAIDSTSSRGPLEFRLGEGEVVELLETLVLSMGLGEHCHFSLPADTAADLGFPVPEKESIHEYFDAVDANVDCTEMSVVLDVKLKTVIAPSATTEKFPSVVVEAESLAVDEKNLGNLLVGRKQYDLAAIKYRKVLEFIENVSLPPWEPTSVPLPPPSPSSLSASPPSSDQHKQPAAAQQQQQQKQQPEVAPQELVRSPQEQLAPISLVCLLNLAACCLKQQQFEKTIQHCSRALELASTMESGGGSADTDLSSSSSSNSSSSSGSSSSKLCTSKAKALFRRGQAHAGCNDWGAAVADFTAAYNLTPANAEIRGQLRRAKERLANHTSRERSAYAKMFA